MRALAASAPRMATTSAELSVSALSNDVVTFEFRIFRVQDYRAKRDARILLIALTKQFSDVAIHLQRRQRNINSEAAAGEAIACSAALNPVTQRVWSGLSYVFRRPSVVQGPESGSAIGLPSWQRASSERNLLQRPRTDFDRVLFLGASRAVIALLAGHFQLVSREASDRVREWQRTSLDSSNE